MIRLLPLAMVLLAATAAPAAAQDALQPQTGQPPQRIDLLAPVEGDDAELEDCSAEQEAASISGEIVVCRRRSDKSAFGYDAERGQRRYARETMNKGNPQAPDVFGIQHQGVTVATGCFIPPCPPPPAYYIDFSTLPDAPPGSDADRISRGLPPLGRDAATPQAESAARAERLGLPEAQAAGEEPEVSPSGSASPAAEPSG